jgi:hypothetical protein
LNLTENEQRKLRRGMIFWGIAATGFSISNIVPALLVAFPLWRGFRLTRRQITGAIIGVTAIVILGGAQLAIKFHQEHDSGNFLVFALSRLGYWLHVPDATAVFRSLRALIMAQFGVPTADRCNYSPAVGAPYDGVILKDAPNLLQITAAVCWFLGIVFCWRIEWGNTHGQAQRGMTIGCLFALLWLVTFHSFFASDEAYMFSVHAWPFVLIPGLLALRDGFQARRLPVLLPLGIALLLALIQTTLALPALFRLPF